MSKLGAHKKVIVINGRGGVGKDTLCEVAGQHYKVMNVSSIDPIKELARQIGWNGEKDHRSRKLLADMKRIVVEYNDYPTSYLQDIYYKFKTQDLDIMFVHIREPEEIHKFKQMNAGNCVTLLVKRSEVEHLFGNNADDNVENYHYDYIFDNSGSLEESSIAFIELIGQILYGEE